MKQSKFESAIESILSVLIGFVVSYLAWPPIAALSDIEYDHSQHFSVIFLFTVLSVVRSYIVRRLFNARILTAWRTK
ncbi:DUF7220 family protein [Thalassolituus sp. UBA3500]|uniref:DUF7220 family protein n=1 Tax=Thalassolituus sp. UBA3500 TaxID=1947664 RepID=UPI000C0DA830|nr:hypothetical protein [Oceanospirillaceae bacterium]